ncbi:hypothetical protein K503DRAFT_776952 [Rhizopogon vinicolor AM-OR11-026]|uniref:Uncharacterized protein n=1 Tax=Rhizopogon vinicolor AM-OR11-026 TaxID=1314800 RepID=A0A1B7MHQ6_9AGAM|nr:hypothetical protein K503DRAFT_776952 [Rhizopogon vinicolor AM-OR11-026]
MANHEVVSRNYSAPLLWSNGRFVNFMSAQDLMVVCMPEPLTLKLRRSLSFLAIVHSLVAILPQVQRYNQCIPRLYPTISNNPLWSRARLEHSKHGLRLLHWHSRLPSHLWYIPTHAHPSPSC